MEKDDTPSARLADKVFVRLADAGLVRGARREALLVRLAAGRLTAADWRSELDFAGEETSRS